MGVRAIRSKSSDARGAEQEPPLFLTGGLGRCCAQAPVCHQQPWGDSRGQDSTACTGLSCPCHCSHQQGRGQEVVEGLLKALGSR